MKSLKVMSINIHMSDIFFNLPRELEGMLFVNCSLLSNQTKFMF